MPTLEYKIRKLAEILAEQGVFLEVITLGDPEWYEFLTDAARRDDSKVVTLQIGDRSIQVMRKWAPHIARPGQAPPMPNVGRSGRIAPGQPLGTMPAPAITPQVPMTPPSPLQQGWAAIEEQKCLSQKQDIAAGAPLGIEGCLAQGLGTANEAFNAGEFNAGTNEVD